MKKKKEIPPSPSPPYSKAYADSEYVAMENEFRMDRVQATLEQLLKECKALRLDERSHTELMIRQMKAMVMMTPPPPPPAPQLMMRETLDKEGKVMTREFIPVSVPRRSI